MSRPKKISKKSVLPKATEPRGKKEYIAKLLGMRDVLPADYKYVAAAVNKIVETANLYSFNRMETPVLENFNLYKKSARLKDLYSFANSKGDKIALRPDLTSGMVRAYLEHDMNNLPHPIKLFAMGPVFRQENRVQTGCYRQFKQFVFEIFGDDKPIAEAFIIAVVYNLFQELQVNVQIQINSVGSAECQKEYIHKLVKFYKEHPKKSKICNECKKNLVKNPLALLECNEPACLEVRNEAPQIANFLSEESSQYFTRVLEYLDELEINYNFNPLLIKGQNYYTETIFEVWSLNDEGQPDDHLSLGRGGRYNNMVEQIGGKPTYSVGFAGGLERLVLKMKEKNLLFKKEDDIVFIAQLSESARLRGLSLFRELYKAGFSVRQGFTTDDLKNQLEEAKNVNAKIVLILGKKEVSNETILFRDVEQGVQEVIAQKDLRERLQKRFNLKNK